MAIGKRIKFFRKKQGMTQKQLGELLGFLGNTSDVRIAQYESETRIPKPNLIEKMASIFKINANALTVPNIDNDIGLLHTLFALEDIYGLKINEINGTLCLCFDSLKDTTSSSINTMFREWQHQATLLKNNSISKEEYDKWRYQYSQLSSHKE